MSDEFAPRAPPPISTAPSSAGSRSAQTSHICRADTNSTTDPRCCSCNADHRRAISWHAPPQGGDRHPRRAANTPEPAAEQGSLRRESAWWRRPGQPQPPAGLAAAGRGQTAEPAPPRPWTHSGAMKCTSAHMRTWATPWLSPKGRNRPAGGPLFSLVELHAYNWLYH